MDMLKGIRAVVFDLDDTLVSERMYVESGFKHIAKLLSNERGIEKETTYQLLMDLFNIDSKHVFNRMFDSLQISYEHKDIIELVQAYRNHKPEICFYEDVIPCLRRLKNMGMKTGIITDGYAITQRNKLAVLQADKYFDYMIITDELGENRKYWKPHPKTFELMKEALGIEFNEMIYVGDNPEKDFYISALFPIRTVRIERIDGVYAKMKHYKDVKEDINIKNLASLIHIID